MKLAIVIGHSKKSPGRVTEYVTEYELNKELSEAIEIECNHRNLDCEVIERLNGYNKMPRDINFTEADYAICVHHNGFDDESVNGTETIYYRNSKVSKKFSKIINDKMVECLGYSNRDIKPVDSEDRGGYVLKYTNMPCILIEPYFTTHKESVQNRDTLKLARFIVDGYENFLEEE